MQTMQTMQTMHTQHMFTHPNIKFVTVEGNIGAGKTTFLKYIESVAHPYITVLYEPVDEWIKSSDTMPSLFELYNTDRKKYAFLFQMHVFQTRICHLAECVAKIQARIQEMEKLSLNDTTQHIIVMERCCHSDYEIFVKMLHEQGCLSDLEMQVYQGWYNIVNKKLAVSGVVYLNTPFAVCLERMTHRNRTSENNIGIEYLEDLHTRHECWIKNVSIDVYNYDTCVDEVDRSRNMSDMIKWITSIQ